MPLCFYNYVCILFLLAMIDHFTFVLIPVSQKSGGVSYSFRFSLENIYLLHSLRFNETTSCMNGTKRKRRM